MNDHLLPVFQYAVFSFARSYVAYSTVAKAKAGVVKLENYVVYLSVLHYRYSKADTALLHKRALSMYGVNLVKLFGASSREELLGGS